MCVYLGFGKASWICTVVIAIDYFVLMIMVLDFREHTLTITFSVSVGQ